ncbi:TPA: tlde1 domain-containing protein [Klebsiella pneumoniae]
MLCRRYPSRANIDGFTRVISASGVRAGAIAKCLKINKSRANTNRFITFCRELRRGKSDWFALWRDDRGIDDETWVEGVKLGNFRLYPGTVSEGCMILPSNSGHATK